MITLVIGGSGSGKSAYAEKCLEEYKEEKYYLATMKAYGDEGKQKVERHKRLRQGKCFSTIEQPVDISDAIKYIGDESKAVILLECISNLVANEMFGEDNISSAHEVAEKIVRQIQLLASKVKEIVIVSNIVTEDGIEYDKGTMEYIKAISEVNIGLSELAERVVEVVVGIPVYIK